MLIDYVPDNFGVCNASILWILSSNSSSMFDRIESSDIIYIGKKILRFKSSAKKPCRANSESWIQFLRLERNQALHVWTATKHITASLHRDVNAAEITGTLLETDFLIVSCVENKLVFVHPGKRISRRDWAAVSPSKSGRNPRSRKPSCKPWRSIITEGFHWKLHVTKKIQHKMMWKSLWRCCRGPSTSLLICVILNRLLPRYLRLWIAPRTKMWAAKTGFDRIPTTLNRWPHRSLSNPEGTTWVRFKPRWQFREERLEIMEREVENVNVEDA